MEAHPIVIRAAASQEEMAAALSDRMERLVLPLLPPVVQQEIADDTEAAAMAAAAVISVDLEGEEGAGEVLVFGERAFTLEEALAASNVDIQAALSGGALWPAEHADAADEAGEAHAVQQGLDFGEAEKRLSSSNPPANVQVAHGDRVYELMILPTLTGLQLKSLIIRELGLDGGFQDYYLTLDGTPFGSRTLVGMHASFADGCRMELEDVGDRPKAVGHT